MRRSSALNWRGRLIRGAVFDLDGTLTNSIEAYYQVFREATLRSGIQVEKSDVLEPLAEGVDPWDRAIPEHIPNRLEKIEYCKSLIPRISREAIGRVRLFPGVGRVLTALAERNVQLGIVTDSLRQALTPLRDRNLNHHFGAIISREDGFPRKPQPDGIMECLRRLGVAPADALTIGDSLVDIRVGKKVGTMTIGVLSGVAKRSQMEAESPTAVAADVLQLLTVLNLAESVSDSPVGNSQ
jgi:phosphoglycolate phosphatase